MKSRILRVFPAVCLLTALASFVAFHFSKITPRHYGWGWRFWPEMWRELKHLDGLIRMPYLGMILASFVTAALLILTSPFLLPVIRRSRMLWIILTIISATAGIGIWAHEFVRGLKLGDLSGGGLCLLLANTLNFLGLATARLGIRPAPDPHGFAGNRDREILPETGNPENLPE